MEQTTPQETVRPDGPQGRGFFTFFVVIVCVGLAVEVVLLVRTNRKLRTQLAEVTSLVEQPPPEIQPGERFELPALVSEDGDEVTVEFGDDQPRTLVLIYSSSCRACVETIPVWNTIMPSAQSASLRVVPILLGIEDSLPATETPLAAPVYTLSSAEETFARTVLKVPTTILLDAHGVVEQAWIGYMTDEKALALREALATSG